jgi:hypothetical protein
MFRSQLLFDNPAKIEGHVSLSAARLSRANHSEVVCLESLATLNRRAGASLLVSNEVSADGFTRGVFDRLVASNICRANNLDFAKVGIACFYRVERR